MTKARKMYKATAKTRGLRVEIYVSTFEYRGSEEDVADFLESKYPEFDFLWEKGTHGEKRILKWVPFPEDVMGNPLKNVLYMPLENCSRLVKWEQPKYCRELQEQYLSGGC